MWLGINDRVYTQSTTHVRRAARRGTAAARRWHPVSDAARALRFFCAVHGGKIARWRWRGRSRCRPPPSPSPSMTTAGTLSSLPPPPPPRSIPAEFADDSFQIFLAGEQKPRTRPIGAARRRRRRATCRSRGRHTARRNGGPLSLSLVPSAAPIRGRVPCMFHAARGRRRGRWASLFLVRRLTCSAEHAASQRISVLTPRAMINPRRNGVFRG